MDREILSPSPAISAATHSTSAPEAAGGGQTQYDPAWTIGYRTIETDGVQAGSLELSGELPKGLRGVLYRNGPARHERAGRRYRHWLDGDGMLQAYRLTDSGIAHHARYIHTDKYLAEEKAGRFLRQAYGTVIPDAEPPVSADDMNTANTGVIHHGGELLALWEGGSAYQMHAASLDTIGKKNWRSDLTGVPFSAHPKIDTDGTMWNFGILGNANLLVLYRISPHGQVQKAEAITIPDLPMIHDFVITARHLVFLLPPFKADPERIAAGKSIGESYAWRPEKGMRVLTIEKDDWSRRRIYETEAGMVYHFGNAWEDKQGIIRLSCMRADDDILFQRGYDAMQGEYSYVPGARTTLMTIDPGSGKVHEERMPEETEFPSVDPRYVGRHYSQLVTVARSPLKTTFGYDMIQRRDLESGEVDRYHYGPDFVLEEHLLVPDMSGQTEGSGWVIGTALDLGRQATVLSIFDAKALRNGPVAQAYLPYAMPFGIHGHFVPA